MSSTDALMRLAAVIEGRKPERGGSSDTSYVARLYTRECSKVFVAGPKGTGKGRLTGEEPARMF
jgi:hypothetical protein